MVRLAHVVTILLVSAALAQAQPPATRLSLDDARAAIRVTAAELDDVRRQTVAQVKKAFTDTLVAEATLALAGENLRTIDEVERLQRIRSEKGDISEIARTRAEIDRADALREAAAVQVLADVDATLSQVANQREKVLLLRDTYLPKAQRVRDTVEFAYRRGGVSLLDFLDAQRTYRETSLEHLRALGAYWAALYQLEAAVGGPWETR